MALINVMTTDHWVMYGMALINGINVMTTDHWVMYGGHDVRSTGSPPEFEEIKKMWK
jgi:hypothetical protein